MPWALGELSYDVSAHNTCSYDITGLEPKIATSHMFARIFVHISVDCAHTPGDRTGAFAVRINSRILCHIPSWRPPCATTNIVHASQRVRTVCLHLGARKLCVTERVCSCVRACVCAYRFNHRLLFTTNETMFIANPMRAAITTRINPIKQINYFRVVYLTQRTLRCVYVHGTAVYRFGGFQMCALRAAQFNCIYTVNIVNIVRARRAAKAPFCRQRARDCCC